MSVSNAVRVVTTETQELETAFSSEARTMFPSLAKIVARSTEIATEKLSENLAGFVETLSAVLETLPESCGPYDVDELTFSLSLDGAGKISLIGEVSAGVTSGITLTLRRKASKDC